MISRDKELARLWSINFSSLTLINILTLLLPIIMIPILLRTLGPTQYGVIAMHQYLAQFAVTLIDFGFPIYGVGEVSKLANDRTKLSQFFTSVYAVKFLLFSVTLALAIGTLFLPAANQALGIKSELLMVYFAFAGVTSFQPTWLLQGVQKLHYLILPTLLSRTFILVTVLLMVHGPEDVIWVPICYTAGSMMLLVTSLWYCRPILARPTYPGWPSVRSVFKEGLEVFWSRILIQSYVLASPILIQQAGGGQAVAIYSLCEKGLAVLRIPFDMASNALYPILAKTRYELRKSQMLFLAFLISGLIVTALGIAIAMTFEEKINFWASLPLSNYFSLYMAALIAIAPHGYLGVNVLLNNGHRLALTVSIVGGFLSFIITANVGGLWVDDSIMVVILAMVAVEFTILACRLAMARKNKLI